MKPFLVDRHHKVLPAWAAYRKTLPQAPRLLTLDHHTDTSKPFRNHIRRIYGPDFAQAEDLRLKWIKQIRFSDSASVEDALTRLNNDEHIVTAIAAGIIDSAFVIAHNAADTDLAVFREHRIACRSVDRKPGSRILVRSDYDEVLETSLLRNLISSFDALLAEAGEPNLLAGPYILDIDLDYFNTLASVTPADPTFIRDLAIGAGLITIATEPDYVESCSIEPGVTSDVLLTDLRRILPQLRV